MKMEIGWLEKEEVGLKYQTGSWCTSHCHSWAKLMSVFIFINYFLINFKYDSLPVQAY